jgi:hypothetical protein
MGFKLQIVDIDHNADNIILTNGLTIEKMKIKYNWFLNASVKNCIIGEDSYGLVWYSGEWICGEWEDGTWYSGIWYDGTWKNGKWYSYLIDKSMIISNRLVILDKNNTYSEFISGVWENGDFYGGTFGDENRDVSKGITYNDLTGRTFTCSYWLNGRFHDGIFENSSWADGIFYAGNMTSSYWLNGRFYSGTFNFHNPSAAYPNWYNGSWYGGDFIEGYWYNGNFDQIDKNIKSRFGIANLYDSQSIWAGGNFYNGEFHSGLNLDSSGNTLPSIDSSKSFWTGGNFKGGNWYGGHFRRGLFYNGNWYGGVFNTTNGLSEDCIWYDGNWYNGLWINGIFYDGHFYNGLWLNGQFINGYISTNIIENALTKQILATEINLPVVTAYTATDVTSYSVVSRGRILNNGGATILNRGICYSSFESLPTTGNSSFITDGGSMGNISFLLENLSPLTSYHYRVYASNITGITYSNVIDFITDYATGQTPFVYTLEPPNDIGSEYATLNGHLQFSDTPIEEYGFIWSTGTTLSSGMTTDGYQGQLSAAGPLSDDTDFSLTITTLTGNTTYNYLAYAVNALGIGTGETKTFETLSYTTPTIPIVVTSLYVDAGSVTAKTYGQVTDGGNSPLVLVGMCWATGTSYTYITGNTVTLPPTTSLYEAMITGLTASTMYFIKAFAINGVGVGYGSDWSFTTKAAETIPTVEMISVVT